MTEPTYSRRLSKEDSSLDWKKPAEVLEREIRAFAGWPKSRAKFGDLEIVVTKAHVINTEGIPGNTAVIDKQPVVFCGRNALVIDMLKPANKQEMTGQAFLAGYSKVFLQIN